MGRMEAHEKERVTEMLDTVQQYIQMVADHPTLIDTVAKAQRKYFEALMAEGFSASAATTIVASSQLLGKK
jgi:uncharacterized protein YoaH (UPF0181 family)